ncbi:hypothetical protein Syun_018783 [Stephania yunnanensis]|uniref:Uncharacterized protein n=1 Tax=Stephania yunnanensis TaxID=152371 RepID=A0AAP0NYQ9_9MAGN
MGIVENYERIREFSVAIVSYTLNITTVEGFETFMASLTNKNFSTSKSGSGVDFVLSCVDNYKAWMVVNQVIIQIGMVIFNSSQIPDPIDPSPTSTSTPLDENLFSDLALTSPSPQSPPATAAVAASTPTPPEIPSGSRQISMRKKKDGFFRRN